MLAYHSRIRQVVRVVLSLVVFATGVLWTMIARADSHEMPSNDASVVAKSTQVLEPIVERPSTYVLTYSSSLPAQPILESSREAQRFRPSGYPCAGYTQEDPAYEIEFSERQNLIIHVHAINDTDVTLGIQAPDGSWLCNDDAHARTHDAAILADFAAGKYRVYVGSYQIFQPLHYQLILEPKESVEWTTCAGDDTLLINGATRQEVQGVLDESFVPCSWLMGEATCPWFTPTAPSTCLKVNRTVDVRLRAKSKDFDTSLILAKVQQGALHRSADHFLWLNDDAQVEDAEGPADGYSEIETVLPRGEYVVFVSTYHDDQHGAFTLELSMEPHRP